jgi:hypothetical protein
MAAPAGEVRYMAFDLITGHHVAGRDKTDFGLTLDEIERFVGSYDVYRKG